MSKVKAYEPVKNMKKLNYLNVGCGNRFHKEWINISMSSISPYVKSYNLLNGIPFPDNKVDVIYHSQVLEHFPKEKAPGFIRECYRVLKLGGIMRVVVPDLENIASEYIKHLNENIERPNRLSEANYDWILLEMYDQTVRNYSGGQMEECLRQPILANEQYIMDRIGYMGRSVRSKCISEGGSDEGISAMINTAKKAGIGKLIRSIGAKIMRSCYSKTQKIGAFRLCGEVHMWMYDRFSLSRLLKDVGFDEIEITTPFESNIPQWDKYELDVKNGEVFHPTSLFIEARKPG